MSLEVTNNSFHNMMFHAYNYGSILKSESKRWGYDFTEDDFDDGITYVEDVGAVVEAKSYRPAVYDGVSKGKSVVPYEPKGVGGIRKTSFQDAEIIKTRSKRKLSKRQKKLRLAKLEAEIAAEEEFPPEVWGYQD